MVKTINKDNLKQPTPTRGFDSLHPLPLISNDLRNKRSSCVASKFLPCFFSLPVLAAINLPLGAMVVPRYWFQWVLLFIALAGLAGAICKVYRVLTRVRRERARMELWWSKRAGRWSCAQRGGFRP